VTTFKLIEKHLLSGKNKILINNISESEYYEIYINPSRIELKDYKDIKGFIDEDGNLYVMIFPNLDEEYLLFHEDLLDILKKEHLISYYATCDSVEYGVPVYRVNDSSEFEVGESVMMIDFVNRNEKEEKEKLDKVKEYFTKAKKKNSHLNFTISPDKIEIHNYKKIEKYLTK